MNRLAQLGCVIWGHEWEFHVHPYEAGIRAQCRFCLHWAEPDFTEGRGG